MYTVLLRYLMWIIVCGLSFIVLNESFINYLLFIIIMIRSSALQMPFILSIKLLHIEEINDPDSTHKFTIFTETALDRKAIGQ